MYSFGLVASILHNNQVCHDRPDGSVYLPFGAEYAIRLKNKTDKDALAIIRIDAENVSGGGFVVEEHSTVDIERFVDKAHKFKFVPSDCSLARYADKFPGNDYNGVIEIDWYFRKAPQVPIVPYKPWRYPYTNPWSHPIKPEFWYGPNSNVLCSSNQWSHPITEGVTVEGGVSDQNFVDTTFQKESTIPITMKLILKGKNRGEFVDTTIKPVYCIQCGAKLIRKTARFCSQCGTKV